MKISDLEVEMIDVYLKETNDPQSAAALRINGVQIPTDADVARRIWDIRHEFGMLETMQKVLFAASLIINAVMTILLLSAK